MAVCQNLVPLVNIKIAGKWMFIPLKMVLIGIDPYPYINRYTSTLWECPSLSSQPELLSHNAGHARAHFAGCKCRFGKILHPAVSA